MIAVGVIGLLTVFAVAGVRKAITRARVTQAETDLEMLLTAVSRLACDTGRFPGGIRRNGVGDAEAWDLTRESAGLMKATTDLFPNWKGPYITRIPHDPWGQPYFFDPDYRSGGHMRVAIGSFGPNRRGRNAYDKDDIVRFLDKP